MLHDVAIKRDEVERDALARVIHQHEPHVARDGAIEESEAVASRAHVQIRLPGPVHEHLVAEEAVQVEDVEVELPLRVPGLVAHHQVHVVVPVAPVKSRTRRQAQVRVGRIGVVALEAFAAAIDRAVDVERRGIALVDVLCGVIEHVVVEPVRAHRLAIVAADARDAAIAVRKAGAVIACGRVDRVVARQRHGPAIVIILAREEPGAGNAIAFGRIMAVVLMGRQRVQPEAVVGRLVDRQHVVVAEDHGLSHARHQELRWYGAVKGPDRVRCLQREVRMEAHLRGRIGAAAMVEAAGREFAGVPVMHLHGIAQARVGPTAGGRRLEPDLRRDFFPALVGKELAAGAAFRSAGRQRTSKATANKRGPRIGAGGVGDARRHTQQRLRQERVDL